jgi:hypothetical protein
MKHPFGQRSTQNPEPNQMSEPGRLCVRQHERHTHYFARSHAGMAGHWGSAQPQAIRFGHQEILVSAASAQWLRRRGAAGASLHRGVVVGLGLLPVECSEKGESLK